ncbi:54S ribosomal protein L3 mitochondrial [Coemansia sp. Benny D115]|nr:54S ribosomal protein L3 mitochondrial [Coemansia sp. Benny D115]
MTKLITGMVRMVPGATAMLGRRQAAMSTLSAISKRNGPNKLPVDKSNASAETFAALEARLNLQFKDRELMELVCTHKSFENGMDRSNERLQWLGKRVLNLVVGEHLYAKYPNLPTESLQDLQHAHFGITSLAEVARHFGMQPAMRWKSVAGEKGTVGLTKVLGKSVQALVGAVYVDQGAQAARTFVRQHLLVKPIDVDSVMQIKNPKLMLVALTKRKNLEYPVARILKETGRFTSSPVFIVGVFCGVRMIGMGFGSSLKMAEYRAAKDALLKHYGKEIKDIPVEGGEAEESELSFFAQQAEA